MLPNLIAFLHWGLLFCYIFSDIYHLCLYCHIPFKEGGWTKFPSPNLYGHKTHGVRQRQSTARAYKGGLCTWGEPGHSCLLHPWHCMWSPCLACRVLWVQIPPRKVFFHGTRGCPRLCCLRLPWPRWWNTSTPVSKHHISSRNGTLCILCCEVHNAFLMCSNYAQMSVNNMLALLFGDISVFVLSPRCNHNLPLSTVVHI